MSIYYIVKIWLKKVKWSPEKFVFNADIQFLLYSFSWFCSKGAIYLLIALLGLRRFEMCQNDRGDSPASCTFWASGVELLTVLMRTLDVRGKCNIRVMSHFSQLIKKQVNSFVRNGKTHRFLTSYNEPLHVKLSDEGINRALSMIIYHFMCN